LKRVIRKHAVVPLYTAFISCYMHVNVPSPTLVKAAIKAATGTIHRIPTPKSEHKQAKVTEYKQPIHDWTMYQHLTTATFTNN
jgi:hypothetical protein